MKGIAALALSIAFTAGSAGVSADQRQEKSVHFYNWIDFIAPGVTGDFQKETGVKVISGTFDSGEFAQGKLLAGRSGYDVVVITSNLLPNLIKAGVLQELEHQDLKEWSNLDPQVMKNLSATDPGNRYAVPYLWGTTGIAYDAEKVRQYLGADAPTNSWDLIFKEENISKLSKCGVAMLDSSTEILSIALNYLGLPYNSQNPADYEKAQALILKVRPYIRYFDSSKLTADLTNGNICVSVGWQGTAYLARNANKRGKVHREIGYSIPKEGSLVWIENMVLLKDAPHPEEGRKFINFMIKPDVIAKSSSYIGYPNGNRESFQYVEKTVREDPAVYFDDETMKRLFPLETLPLKAERVRTRVWNRIKSGL
ncbi:TPA: polyamine ABC transporter substrate-binding protein [Pseudomonas aeruginosa]|nr:polyamine ABC transporter substrate-binding protein [Pseudomonas aeruginosa]HEJ2069624.1 polyamine ABC transporter substrate-binding protein [Pseudomonas aeruginosa]HEJ4470014.1 polyamine ABC transporter substrate-binding protein [Pseudomonas aeruginosa]HEJ5100676.1 polyamine ABC transporter substrate-binding protein [Pseudomonas aeruginosa]HEJ5113146.1 polyamine ABC transporter substrate-binding protein [Pseudomonas aeruginosa]